MMCRKPAPKPVPRGARMAKPDTLIVDGHAYKWQRLLDLRRQQLEAWQAEQCRQLTLFRLKDDRRPDSEHGGWTLPGADAARLVARRDIMIAPVLCPLLASLPDDYGPSHGFWPGRD